jgi:hypothetical protein
MLAIQDITAKLLLFLTGGRTLEYNTNLNHVCTVFFMRCLAVTNPAVQYKLYSVHTTQVFPAFSDL